VKPSASWIGPAALLGAAAIWGFVPVSTRHVLETLSPGQVVLARFAFSSIVVIAIMLLLHPAMPPRRHLVRTICFGLLGTLGFLVPLTLGLQYVEAGTAALLNATSPIFTAALAALVLHEVVRPRVVAGLSLALLGSVVTAAGSGGGFGLSGEELLGSCLVLLAGLLWAIYSVTVKPWLGPIPPASIPMLGSLAGLPLVLPFGVSGFVAGLSALDAVGWLSLLQFAVGASVVAPILFALGLQRSPATRAAIYSYLTPLFGVVAGAVLLGETIGPATLAGGMLILGGVLLATLPARSNSPAVRARHSVN
jgi:drug/metabolite transporter (DMT)-like permease